MSLIEQRLTELEVRLVFIDEAVQALVTADAQQSMRIAALERSIRDLRTELERARLGQVPDPHRDLPPHY